MTPAQLMRLYDRQVSRAIALHRQKVAGILSRREYSEARTAMRTKFLKELKNEPPATT